jgi:flagellar protein FlgJ
LLANRLNPAGEAVAADNSQQMQPVRQQAVRSYTEVGNSLPVPPGKMAVPERFSSPGEFVAAMLPMAEQAAQRLGVDPNYLVAQAALETGWGKHMQRGNDGNSSYNLFGIKSHGWKGASASAQTSEFVNGRFVRQTDSFRKYDSFAQSFNDYVSFLQQNPRYEKALQAAGNAESYVRELQRAGYATDPDYAAKISRIARQIQQQQPAHVAQGSSISERT